MPNVAAPSHHPLPEGRRNVAYRRDAGDVVEMGQRLDRIEQTMTDLRVSMAENMAEMRVSMAKLEANTGTPHPDVESRLRGLERRAYAIPSLAALLAIAGLAVALWTAFTRHA